MAKYTHVALISFMLGAATMAVVSPVMASPETHRIHREVQSAPQASTCGDGICDPYVGENKTTCSVDCGSNPVGSNPTQVPTSTSDTPTATGTLAPLLILPTQATVTLTSGTGTPGTPTATPTLDSSGTPPSNAPALQAGCDFVSYESRTGDWQAGYATFAGKFVPAQADQREVFVCRVPPQGQVCIPVYNGLLDAAGGGLDKVVLVDCSAGGDCTVHQDKLKMMVSGMLCVDTTVSGSISCTGGCALAPSATATSLLAPPDLRALYAKAPAAAIVPVACLLALLLMGGVGFLILITRRARRSEVDEDAVAAD